MVADKPEGRAIGLSWSGIVRLGLVQTSLGAIVVLTTSTMNRVMVIEQALPAMIPGVLVALHYIVQLSRPRFGHASDQSGRRTPWIITGMGILAVGGLLAAVATAWAGEQRAAGLALALIAFLLIGIGVGTSGTSLLALLAARVDDSRRAAAGSLVWIMMIIGFIVTAGIAGHYLEPYSHERLIVVTAVVGALAFSVTLLAVAGVEPRRGRSAAGVIRRPDAIPFRTALSEVWGDSRARVFTIFVFVAMLAYSTQDLILEPFAGAVFAMTPGQSTQLAGLQSAGVLGGMLLLAVCGTLYRGPRSRLLKTWTMGGCLASGAALLGLSAAGVYGPGWPLEVSVILLGVANGAFAAAAIGLMMALAGDGAPGREGVRLGLWGAAQAMAFALGGIVGTAAIDLLRLLLVEPALTYAAVFAAEALIFIAAATLARRITTPDPAPDTSALPEETWRLST